ncbi:carboxypeptidase-like regulatory domain-containing protein [Hymenobacter sp. J193]|uniref:carboxypeptidase-like regulatory domain-containing protein n=1 Tax=Hymenobacter sp. J193 TaxID=2898429 RepID=UPI002151BB64|nr:carboxypeptidase-like regulatory domain-containing protein [Hymenobacter sp. J193]MCR5889081.1 carboxypeptidase-like regulatory domain-containing protein [Hymenobacter sp. J193]
MRFPLILARLTPAGRRGSLLLLLLLLAAAAHAQVLLRGTVIDADTREPLPFVSIGVSGTSLGTASNENGEFTLSVPSLPRTLVVSELSHQKDTVRVTSAGPLTLELRTASITLPEVKVGSYPFQLVDRAYRRLLRDNRQKFYGKAFYRQTTRINGAPTELQEVIWNVKSNSSRIEGTTIAQGRYAGVPTVNNFSNFSVYTRMFGLFTPDSTISLALLSPNTFQNYLLELKGIVAGADSTKAGVAEIDFETRPEIKYRAKGTVWIDADTYQVLRYLVSTPSFTGTSTNPTQKFSNPEMQYDMAFQEAASPDAVGPLTYVKTSLTADLTQPGKTTLPVSVQTLTFFYDTSTTPTDLPYARASLDDRDLDAIRSVKYNPEFWENNSIVKRTPLEDEVIAAFEKRGAFGTMVKKAPTKAAPRR